MTNVRISDNALSSVAAVLANPGGPSEKEKEQSAAFEELLSKCTLKPEGHTQRLASSKVTRLYTVTTITSSARYGGTRTPVVCSSFELAKDYVEGNLGDLYECSYSLAVVEAVAADRLYTHLDEVYWYMWQGDPRDGAYHAIEVPPGFEGRSFQPIG